MKVTRRQALKTIVSGSTGVLLSQQLGGESSRVLAQAVPQEKPQDKPKLNCIHYRNPALLSIMAKTVRRRLCRRKSS